MIYKFKSKAAGDVIMLGRTGDEVLRALGREPSAKGIIEVDAMAAAIAALEDAVEADDARRAPAKDDAGEADESTESARPDGVTLRQRVWPLVDMLRRSQAAGEAIVWGV
jgi:hypothetical protein